MEGVAVVMMATTAHATSRCTSSDGAKKKTPSRLEKQAPSNITSNESASSLKSSVFLVLLALQIGIQPELMKWYAKDATNVSLRITVIGILKILVALVPLVWTGEWRCEFSSWSSRVALRTTVLPALIYSVQDYLNQTAVVILDGVTYNVLNQTKIIWTALLVYVMLGQKQSSVQVVALVVLVASAVLIAVGGHSHDGSQAKSSIEDDVLRVTGMGRAAIAAVLSAFAGTIIQKALQKEARNAYMVTLELSAINIACCVWSNVANRITSSSTSHQDEGGAAAASLWTGWTFMTFVTLLVQALGGVLVGFVIKYSGNIKKSFAVVGGLLLTAACESVVNETEFGVAGYIATGLATLSTMLYTKFPPTASAPTPRLRKTEDASASDESTESSSDDEDNPAKRLIPAA
ncbi:hypothetical protein AaE_002893 [Aphanomyces astaci]|uniref:Sugar phosphate transporter domain-containing protein n=2 Tax=Aphanomyces astaci TaxID=112090 RepID=A0A6A5A8L2_APHAT|nr:hypothetical protein AaE_002893 [Aphanomyces astaci]